MNDKSIADVLDNTVNQLSNGVQALGNAIQKVAPDAWRILVHQQKVLAIQDITLGTLAILSLLISIFIYTKFVITYFNRLKAENPGSDYDLGKMIISILYIIACIMVVCISINTISDGVVRYNSVNYYAAKDALSMVKQ